MKTKGKNRVKDSIEVIIIAIALLAITLSGSSLITIRSFDSAKTDLSKSAETNKVLSYNLNLAIGHNTVAHQRPADQGKTFFFTIPAVVSLYNLNESRPVTPIIELKPNKIIDFHFSERLTTAASISPEKAQEFTLVGAKPSGVS
jgi:hypothetical protein